MSIRYFGPYSLEIDQERKRAIIRRGSYPQPLLDSAAEKVKAHLLEAVAPLVFAGFEFVDLTRGDDER